MPGTLNRRTFISRSAAVAGGGALSLTALERLAARDGGGPDLRGHRPLAPRTALDQ